MFLWFGFYGSLISWKNVCKKSFDLDSGDAEECAGGKEQEQIGLILRLLVGMLPVGGLLQVAKEAVANGELQLGHVCFVK